MNYSIEFTIVHCPNCSMPFCISKSFEEKRRDDHKGFYCPAGHYMAYDAETEAEKYKRLYKTKKDCCEFKARQLKTARASFYGLKGHVAKLKKQLAERI